MSKRRPITDFPRNEPGLVDNFIGTAYDTVKVVSDNIDKVQRVADDIDNIENIADTAFKNAVDKNMPGVYENIDTYTESKKPEIDEYVETGKKEVTDHTAKELVKIDTSIEAGKIAIDKHVSDKVLEVDTQVDLAKGYAADAKQSAKESSDSAASTMNQLNLNKAQVALATAEAERAKTQANEASTSAIASNNSAIRAENALTDVKKSATQAEQAKDTAVSASVSADYSRQEAFRSETEVKRIQGEVNAKATQVDTNAQKVSEDRADTKKFRDEAEGFKNTSGESAKTSEYWAEKAKEYSGMDTSAFVNRADLAQTTGEALNNPMSQKAVTESLKTKAGTAELEAVDTKVTNLVKNQVVQDLGTNTDKVISQKVVTDNLNLKAVKTEVTTELNKKLDKSSVKTSLGTSATDTMSQKAITDELAKKGNSDALKTEIDKKWDIQETVGNAVGKIMREGAYGLGDKTQILPSTVNIDLDDIETGFYTTSGEYEGTYPEDYVGNLTGQLIVLKRNTVDPTISHIFVAGTSGGVFNGNIYHRNKITGVTEWTKWIKLYSENNTKTDKNGVIHAGTTVPKDTLNIDSITTSVNSETTSIPSNKAVTDALAKKVDKTQVKSAFGTSTTDVASQKLVTDVNNLVTNANTEIAKKANKTDLDATNKEVALKGNLTYIDAELAKKRNVDNVSFLNSVMAISPVEGDTDYIGLFYSAHNKARGLVQQRNGSINYCDIPPEGGTLATQPWVNSQGFIKSAPSIDYNRTCAFGAEQNFIVGSSATNSVPSASVYYRFAIDAYGKVTYQDLPMGSLPTRAVQHPDKTPRNGAYVYYRRVIRWGS